MIHADRKLLKANLTRGTVDIQTKLITLYAWNLRSITTQAALIGGFAFTSNLELVYPTSGYECYACELVYQGLVAVCLGLCFFIISQATIITQQGPEAALVGTTPDIVLKVAAQIRSQQKFIYFLGVLSLSAFLFAVVILFWSKIDTPVIASSTIIIVAGYAFIVYEAYRTYSIFHPKQYVDDGGVNFTHRTKTGTEESTRLALSSLEDRTALDTSIHTLQEVLSLRVRGTIYYRQSLSRGSKLVKCYGVLDRGMIDAYATERDFIDNRNPINRKPFHLKDYFIETDQKKCQRRIVTLKRSIREKILGQPEFSVMDMLRSEYDLTEALKSYRFLLAPIITSELSPTEIVEFMCTDSSSFELWTTAIQQITSVFDKMRDDPDETTGIKSTSVEMAVYAANKVGR